MRTRGVPVIDIGDLTHPATLAALDAACRDWGFFQVVGHGVRPQTTASLMREMRAFFHQDCRTKRTIERSADNPWGFYDRELTKNTRDWKEVYDVGPADEGGIHPQWPAALPEFRPALEAFYEGCEALAFRLLGALSLNLGMNADHLEGSFRPHSSFVRLNYYPVCPLPERPRHLLTPTAGHLGINHHTDAGALTILLQDSQPGLEVYRHGDWHLVTPVDGALVINIGDIVQVWSNDRYPAALHRVTANALAERFSAPFFFNPDYRADYAPLPSTLQEGQPPRYCAINWGEFRGRRTAGDYADVGEEVQIGHYRIGGSGD
jgi:isopenicillin N synthase-like dioxygenase